VIIFDKINIEIQLESVKKFEESKIQLCMKKWSTHFFGTHKKYENFY